MKNKGSASDNAFLHILNDENILMINHIWFRINFDLQHCSANRVSYLNTLTQIQSKGIQQCFPADFYTDFIFGSWKQLPLLASRWTGTLGQSFVSLQTKSSILRWHFQSLLKSLQSTDVKSHLYCSASLRIQCVRHQRSISPLQLESSQRHLPGLVTQTPSHLSYRVHQVYS